jgi:hypothetical protein
MSKFNQAVRTGVRSPVISVTSPGITTAEGDPGFARDSKSELFLLAVNYMASEKDTFYETAQDRDSRLNALLHMSDIYSDTKWVLGFVKFLREQANLRSAPIVVAAEVVHSRLISGVAGNRDIVSAALQRPDEPGEFLAYWTSKYGRNIPKPVKRGISDAAQRLFHERSYLKYDSPTKAFRWADILQLVHAEPKGPDQSVLYKHVLDVRYGSVEPAEGLPVLYAHQALMSWPVDKRRDATAGQLKEAGLTWESLAGWQQGEMDAAAWEKVIPSMGAMALLRNLRNFDQAGISKSARRAVEDVLEDAEQIKRSRQLPLRFLSAYRATRDSGTVTGWAPTIEKALDLSLQNVPALPGRTLVLVDVSASMNDEIFGSRSKLRRVEGAALFGAALWKRSEEVDLYAYNTQLFQIQVPKSTSVLPLADQITKLCSGGTETGKAIATTFRPGYHDRIILLTDEQSGNGFYNGSGYRTRISTEAALQDVRVPVYTWNLAGYQYGHAPSGQEKRHTFAGLSDASFRIIPLLEAGQSQDWGKLFSSQDNG